MPFNEMVAGISGGVLLLIGFIYFLRLIHAWLLHRALREAINRDSAVAATLLDRVGTAEIGGPSAGGVDDDRTGMILIALGVALAGFALVVGDPEWIRYGLGGSLFPTLVGLALLLRHHLQRRKAEGRLAADV